MDFAVFVVKTKALTSCACKAHLICSFVIAYIQKAGFLMTKLDRIHTIYRMMRLKQKENSNQLAPSQNETDTCSNFDTEDLKYSLCKCNILQTIEDRRAP